MKLYESAEDYLERILILSKELESVHSIDIARDMNFSKPSVSVAMHKLQDSGYILFQEDGTIVLTAEGRKIAEKVYDRHLTITKALVKLGVNEEQAKIDACKIEHDISEETFQALKKAIK
jgi:Mn-dependent DtxR family transcriptional regulator